MKNRCEKHHYTFEGNRCPICEKERIAEMVHKFIPRTVEADKAIHNIRDKSNMEKHIKPNANWEDLCDKFVVVKEKNHKK